MGDHDVERGIRLLQRLAVADLEADALGEPLLVSQPPRRRDHVRAEIDADDPAGELGPGRDRARRHPGAAAQVEHAARPGERQTIEIGIEHGGEARMAAPLLEARDRGIDRRLLQELRAAVGPDHGHALSPRAASYTSRAAAMSSTAMPTESKIVVSSARAGFVARQDLAELGVDLGAREDDVAALVVRGLARFDHDHVRHGGVVQLARGVAAPADGVDVRAGLQPGALEDRRGRCGRRDDHVGAAHRVLGAS